MTTGKDYRQMPDCDPLPPDPRKPMHLRADRIVVDDNFQRTIEGSRYEAVFNMGLDWDWVKSEAVTVVPIAGGMYRAVEGQGRVLALQLREPTAKLWSMVLPTEYVGHGAEARIALGIATGRRAHSAFERWRLRLADSEPFVTEADRVITAHHLHVAQSGSSTGIAAVAALLGIITRGNQSPKEGAELLDATLRVLLHAWPVDPVDAQVRFDSLVLRVVSTVLYRNPDIDEPRLVRVLADKSVRRWLNDVDGNRSKYNLLGESIVAAYNRRKRGPRALWNVVDPAAELAKLVEIEEEEAS